MADSYNSEDLERFQRDYYRYGKHDLKRQIPHLAALADYYKRKYSRTLDWTDCIKVSVQIYKDAGFSNPKAMSFSQYQGCLHCERRYAHCMLICNKVPHWLVHRLSWLVGGG